MTKTISWNNWEEFFESGTIMTRENGEILIGWGKREWIESPSREDSDLLFYFPDFFLNKTKPWFRQAHTEQFTIKELLEIWEKVPEDPLPSFKWQNPYKEIYLREFNILKQLFAENKLDKAVPFAYDLSDTSMTASLLIHSVKNALKYVTHRPAYVMGFWDKKEGVLAVSPELLFEIDLKDKVHPKLYTVALGGTFFTNDLEQLKDQKLKEEHQIIVDRIVKNLTPYGNVECGKLTALPYASLYHLLTKIQVKLNPKHIPKFEEIVKAMHPTPALGASPPEEGKKWLKHYQSLIDRGYYGAPAGYEWKKKSESKCYVNIRNIQWRQDQLLIAGGGGVIGKSEFEKEWLEIQNKIRSIKSIFDITT